LAAPVAELAVVLYIVVAVGVLRPARGFRNYYRTCVPQ